MARYYDRTRAMQRARNQAEDILAAILMAAFGALWRLIYPRLRDNRLSDIDAMIAAWAGDWGEDYDGGLVAAAGAFTETERALWGQAGKDITLDPEQIVRDFSADTAANVGAGRGPWEMIAGNIRMGVGSEIAKWQATPGATRADLDRRLRTWMDKTRAKTIAATDATNLASAVTAIGMAQAGVGFWIWQTREDEDVCERCAPLHGRIFTLSDLMPPLHHNCRCEMTPLKEWLKVHDQPFFGIAAGLAERAE